MAGWLEVHFPHSQGVAFKGAVFEEAELTGSAGMKAILLCV